MDNNQNGEITGLQVLESFAGYFVGRLVFDKEDEVYYPYTRESIYFKKREEAEKMLNSINQ